MCIMELYLACAVPWLVVCQHCGHKWEVQHCAEQCRCTPQSPSSNKMVAYDAGTYIVVISIAKRRCRPSGADMASVTNQLVTCGFGPNTVSPEPSPTYNHLPDHCLAMHTQCAPAQAPADHVLQPPIHRALSTQPNVASAPVLIQRHLHNLPQPSTRVPLCSDSSGFPHHVGSTAAVPLAMTPVQPILTPVQLTDTCGLTPLIFLEL
jgi:hypothetical protein